VQVPKKPWVFGNDLVQPSGEVELVSRFDDSHEDVLAIVNLECLVSEFLTDVQYFGHSTDIPKLNVVLFYEKMLVDAVA
jgi:hypothetical protein